MMERAIIHSGLARDSIQPAELLGKYFELLRSDIKEALLNRPLKEVGCPVSGEMGRRGTFEKMGLVFNKSENFGNIYISPRPTESHLKEFYFESRAREFWLTELWSKTREERMSKIIAPQLEWVRDGLIEHRPSESFAVAELAANNWGYAMCAREIIPQADYSLVEPMIAAALLPEDLADNIKMDLLAPESQDAVLLFEALDRSFDPRKTLSDAKVALKEGGLCFLTCLLSSGFESQVLGEASDIFIPPERMNIFSYEGLLSLLSSSKEFEIIEFSTPSVLDVENVIQKLKRDETFLHYILKERSDAGLLRSFQEFLQFNRLGTFGRVVLQKHSMKQ